MTEAAPITTCRQFQSRLPEEIDGGENLAADSNLQHWPLCRALLADLEAIAKAARELFPVAEPRDDLWEQIQNALRDERGPRGFENTPR